MIHAGIDEAGYGPLLGPLVVALAAFRTGTRTDGTGSESQPAHDLWEALSTAVARKPRKDGARLPVCDSKELFQRSRGKNPLSALETTALAFSTWIHGDVPATGAEFLRRHAGDHATAARGLPWYADGLADLALPLAAEPEVVRAHASRLRVAGRAADVTPHVFAIRPATEDEFNTGAERCGSKARLLFELNVDLLLACRRDVTEPIRVHCDRHGGRSRYGGLLASAFPLEPIRRLGESDSISSYRVGAGDGTLEVVYAVGGEAESLPTALASILAKYTREIFMEAFNRYFVARAPSVAPTAGYYTDGLRFLDDLDAVRAITVDERLRAVRRR